MTCDPALPVSFAVLAAVGMPESAAETFASVACLVAAASAFAVVVASAAVVASAFVVAAVVTFAYFHLPASFL